MKDVANLKSSKSQDDVHESFATNFERKENLDSEKPNFYADDIDKGLLYLTKALQICKIQ